MVARNVIGLKYSPAAGKRRPWSFRCRVKLKQVTAAAEKWIFNRSVIYGAPEWLNCGRLISFRLVMSEEFCKRRSFNNANTRCIKDYVRMVSRENDMKSLTFFWNKHAMLWVRTLAYRLPSMSQCKYRTDKILTPVPQNFFHFSLYPLSGWRVMTFNPIYYYHSVRKCLFVFVPKRNASPSDHLNSHDRKSPHSLHPFRECSILTLSDAIKKGNFLRAAKRRKHLLTSRLNIAITAEAIKQERI